MISTRQTSKFTEISTEVINIELLKVKKFISKSAGITASNRTLFFLAAEYGHLDIVKYLLDEGVRV